MAEDFKLKKGRELIITVPKKTRTRKKQNVQIARHNHSLIISSKGEGYFPRRLQKAGINFYDFGQIKVGEIWQTLDFSYAPTIDESSGEAAGTIEFGLAQFNDLKAKIFEVPLNEFIDKYRKIDFDLGAKYGIDVYTGDTSEAIDPDKRFAVSKNGERYFIAGGDTFTVVTNSKWSAAGLKIPASAIGDQFAVICKSIALGFGSEFIPYKITTTDDFEADAVDFDFSQIFDIFLVPVPVFNLATCFFAIAGLVYNIPKREFFLDNPVIENFYESIAGLLPISTFAAPQVFFIFNAIAASLTTYIQTTVDARYYVYDGAGGGAFEDINNFPSLGDDITAQFDPAASSNATGSSLLVSETRIEAGVLLAVIRRGTDFFYVWATAEYLLPSNLGFTYFFED